MTTTKTYGSIEHYAPPSDRLRPYWVLEATPNVMMRLKRIFPRVRTMRSGLIEVVDTPEIARDLTWVLQRWPMEMSPGARKRLRARTRLYNERNEMVVNILAGQHTLDLAEPARAPREYQLQAADMALATGRLLLGDDVGLGKSFSGLLLLRDPRTLPALVVTLTHLPKQWLGELEKSLPWLHGHVITTGPVYDPATRDRKAPDVLFISYSKLAKWEDVLAGQVRSVIFDEIQELRRERTLKYTAAGRIADAADFRMGLTATPVYNYGGEIHTIMSLLDEDALGSHEEFVREWGRSAGGGKIAVRDPKALGTFLRDEGLFLRRTRAEVHRELPELVRVPHTVESDSEVLAKLMDGAVDLAELIVKREGTKEERWKASGDLDWQMRHATGVAKAPYVAEFVRLLLESEEKVVLFGWHRDVYDIWLKQLKAYRPVLYTGSESPAQKEKSAAAFLTGNSRVLIMSLRAGAGLDGLQEAARVCVFGELDWSPGIHEQCVGRLHRDGQDDSVVAYFLVSDDGSDPVIAEVLNLKRNQSEPLRDPDAEVLQQADGAADRVRRLAAEVLRRREAKTPRKAIAA